MMKVQSKKILFQKAIPIFIETHKDTFPELETDFFEISSKGLNHSNISNETYGSKSMIYIYFSSMEIRLAFDKYILNSKEFSFKANRNYSKNMPKTEVQVSYFKGINWDH